MLKFLITNRHQLYLYFGFWLVALGCSRRSIFEFVQFLSMDHISLALTVALMLMSVSKYQILRDLGLCILIGSLLVIVVVSK